jgi:hypothetical protein
MALNRSFFPLEFYFQSLHPTFVCLNFMRPSVNFVGLPFTIPYSEVSYVSPRHHEVISHSITFLKNLVSPFIFLVNARPSSRLSIAFPLVQKSTPARVFFFWKLTAFCWRLQWIIKSFSYIMEAVILALGLYIPIWI